jgi:2,4-dienoyl-CoA reductase (NADPH2)
LTLYTSIVAPFFFSLFIRDHGILPGSSALTKDELPGPDFVESKGMTISEVEEAIEMFIKAADRAHKAGFDGVEINAATCTLPNSFLSRVFNKRQDKYGIADLESRARFLTDIVIGTKKRFSPNFAITYQWGRIWS